MFKLFIVEDEEIIRWGLVNEVPWNEWGFSVIGQAENGKVALELISQNSPDVILLDIKMPVMNGIDFMAIVHDLYPSVKLVILSGHNEFEYARKGIQYGVFAYLLKPTKDFEIKETFHKLKKELEHPNNFTRASEEAHINHLNSSMTKTLTFQDSSEALNQKEINEKQIFKTDHNSERYNRISDRMDPIILLVKKYLKENYSSKITLEILAELAHMNASYFSTYFKQKTGYNYKDYLTMLRIEEAKKLLNNKDLKVYEISLMVGYDDFRYFCRLFKEATGKNTMQYRSNLL